MTDKRHYIIAQQRVDVTIRHTTRGPSWEVEIKDAPTVSAALECYKEARWLIGQHLDDVAKGVPPEKPETLTAEEIEPETPTGPPEDPVDQAADEPVVDSTALFEDRISDRSKGMLQTESKDQDLLFPKEE